MWLTTTATATLTHVIFRFSGTREPSEDIPVKSPLELDRGNHCAVFVDDPDVETRRQNQDPLALMGPSHRDLVQL
jgi:hypothetical protein